MLVKSVLLVGQRLFLRYKEGMAVKVKNQDMIDSREALQMLAQKSLPVLVSIQVAKLGLAFSGPFSIFEEVRNALIKEYGQVQEGGQRVVIFSNDALGRPESPNHQGFAKKLTELLGQEFDLPDIKVKLPQEIDGKALQIEPSILMALEKFIEVE